MTYSKHAVDNAIAASNRAGRKIGKGEAKRIHALLKGWRGSETRYVVVENAGY